jgi:predicted GH43/DUF377 family glycosyl hydrolase
MRFIIFIAFSFLFSVFSGQAESRIISDSLPGWALGPFIRPANANPVLSPGVATFFDPVSRKATDWESDNVFNPAATLLGKKIVVLYRAEDKSGNGIGQHTSRIGIAESNDGLIMKKSSSPVLYPSEDNQKENEWPGGCEDPRVAVTANGLYVILYTQWNRKIPRLAVATSKDLVHWKKYGPVFRTAYNGLFFNRPSKSASIVTELRHGKQYITKINGKYWMYWGEENVYAATSDDLINWSPLIEKDSSLKKLMSPRKGYFDSQLTECGPPAMITSRGVILLYNGKNALADSGDTRYTENSYCAGQVLFDAANPERIIDRLDRPFLKPEDAFEKSGQYPAGTVFIEGLVFQKEKWFLYYGCADSRVAVAVYDTQRKDNK